MAATLDSGWIYDRELARLLALKSVQNGELARGKWPVTADIGQLAALVGLPGMMGVGCQLGAAATPRQSRWIAPPFATECVPWIWASGSGNIVISSVSGCSGTATIAVETDGNNKQSAITILGSTVDLTAGDDCREFVVEIERSTTGVQCWGFGFVFGGFAL